ncbi:MAG: CRISPR-associated protein Csx16 [Burkholderiaceae bacterium]
MTRWLVTRHPGARKWMENNGIAFDVHVEHLHADDVAPGDVIIGSLPINLVADICARKSRYFHLTVQLGCCDRGRELTAEKLQALQASLEEFSVTRPEQRSRA